MAEPAREDVEPLLREALDLVPRMSDDDPIAPALADWCRRVRAALAAMQPQWRPIDDLLDAKLPVDVNLPPATIIRKGCQLRTLVVALEARGMPLPPPPAATDAER